MEEKATTDEGRCSKTPGAGTGTSWAVELCFTQESDAICRSQEKGELVPTSSDELCETVLERSGSLPFQVTKKICDIALG